MKNFSILSTTLNSKLIISNAMNFESISPNTLGSNISCTFRGLAFLSKECALLECRSRRHEPNEEIGTSGTKKDTNAKEGVREGRGGPSSSPRSHKSSWVGFRAAEREPPLSETFCPLPLLFLSRGAAATEPALFAYALNIAAQRARFESSHVPSSSVFSARRKDSEGRHRRVRRNERWRTSGERERKRNPKFADCRLLWSNRIRRISPRDAYLTFFRECQHDCVRVPSGKHKISNFDFTTGCVYLSHLVLYHTLQKFSRPNF